VIVVVIVVNQPASSVAVGQTLISSVTQTVLDPAPRAFVGKPVQYGPGHVIVEPVMVATTVVGQIE
jgi:hypothetical protein